MNDPLSCLIEINYEPDDGKKPWTTLFPKVESLLEMGINTALQATSLPKHIKTVEISVLLTEDDFIQTLNKKYRDQDKPTNILSFPIEDLRVDSYDALTFHKNEPVMLGDMVFSRQTLVKEAKEQHISYKDHFLHLIVHGTLHLLGYDHEEDKEAEKMEALEINILKGLHIPNPYLLTEKF